MPKIHKEDCTYSAAGLVHVGCASELYDISAQCVRASDGTADL